MAAGRVEPGDEVVRADLPCGGDRGSGRGAARARPFHVHIPLSCHQSKQEPTHIPEWPWSVGGGSVAGRTRAECAY
ncbi:hypothetical protein GCM10014713_20980 [Streptomyces purpureus]|uniref:Uncharacterized protein n=1 Tax=Streptomyces purpureus TaxID=1951 RepID=A0A918H0W7_9ACTN|nr:hypothetical protein GCM10014713_20980 [Streptomyces purpureus]